MGLLAYLYKNEKCPKRDSNSQQAYLKPSTSSNLVPGTIIQFLIRFLHFNPAVQYPSRFGSIIGNRVSFAVAFGSYIIGTYA